MPSAAKRNYGVILFDVNATNKAEALAALTKICTFIWLSKTKDTYKLILANTKESNNSKHYKNLYETDLDDTDPQPIISYIENAKPQEGDWCDAILLAIDHLKEAYELRGVIMLQILFITKLEGSTQEISINQVERIINDLREYDIYLYIIGPDVKFPCTIISELDLYFVNEDVSNPSLAMAERIVDATANTVVCDLKVGVNLFFSFKNSRGMQPCKMPISFGSRLEIPVCTHRIYRMSAPFKLITKKRYNHYVLLEDESVSVDRSVLISGIERHGKFIKVDETEMFKIEGPRSFTVTGFTHKKNIPEYYMRGNTYYVLPDCEKPNDCSQFLYNLIDVLAEEEKYMIMRRVYNPNTKPKFFVVIPQLDSQPKRFVMSELPYADDLKQKFQFTDPELTETIEDDAFDQFFDSIDVWNDKCKLNIPLGPKMMLEPSTSKLANAAAKKYLQKDFNFEELEINDLEDETNEFLEYVKAFWPENDKPQVKEEVYY